MGWSGNARLNPRRDKNEREIIQALQAQGYHVVQINGTGVPDLLVSKRLRMYTDNGATLHLFGQCWLVEVKQPKAKYKPSQLAFRENFQGPPIITLRSVQDAQRFALLACESGDSSVK